MHLYFQEPFWIPCEIYNRDELHSYLVPLSWTGGRVRKQGRSSYQISGAFVGGLWGVNLTLDDGGL